MLLGEVVAVLPTLSRWLSAGMADIAHSLEIVALAATQLVPLTESQGYWQGHDTH
jgi:hypothetical protein